MIDNYVRLRKLTAVLPSRKERGRRRRKRRNERHVVKRGGAAIVFRGLYVFEWVFTVAQSLIKYPSIFSKIRSPFLGRVRFHNEFPFFFDMNHVLKINRLRIMYKQHFVFCNSNISYVKRILFCIVWHVYMYILHKCI